MREKINRLSKGIIEDINPNISVYPESLDIEIHPGETARFDIILSSENNIFIKGLAYTRDNRINVTPAAFGGKPVKLSCEIQFVLHEGEKSLSGNIDLVTNGGEFSIPYSISSKSRETDNLLSTFNKIEDFADYALSNPDDAINLFEYSKFITAPFMKNSRNAALYTAFKGRANKLLAMKEFISACNSSIKLPSQTKTNSGNTDSTNILDTSDRFIDESTTDQSNIDNDDSLFIRERKRYYKKYFSQFVALRTKYEADNCSDPSLLESMIDTLSRISGYNNKHEYITLLRALTYLDKGERDTCMALLESVKLDILENRQEMLNEYFLYEYIKALFAPKSDSSNSFIRLLYKFIDDNSIDGLFYYVINLDYKLKSDNQKYFTFLKDTYQKGCISPYLYIAYCSFICKHPEYIHNLTDFDLHSLYYGAKHDILNAEVALSVAKSGTTRINQTLYFKLLSILADNYESPELIDTVCSMLVRNDIRDTSCNKYFLSAINNHSAIMGVFEYYLYTLPEDNRQMVPRDVFTHFINDDHLDLIGKTTLYNLVLLNSADNDILAKYSDRIREFVSAQLKNKNINKRMASIYSKALELCFVDRTDSFLPYVLNTFRINCNNNQMKSLIVVYPQISNDAVIPLLNGKAYIPVFSDEAIILFQDAYGNRYYDISYTKSKLIKAKFELNNINEFSSDNVSPILNKISLIMAKDALTDTDCAFIERCILELPLTDSYRHMLFNKLCDFNMSEEFIMTYKNHPALDPSEEIKLSEHLAQKKYYAESYSIIKHQGYNHLSPALIKEICSKLILDRMFTEDKLLMQMAVDAVLSSEYDSIILDYLCEHYNGSCPIMYRILSNSISLGNDTFDMEERLIAQLIFCNNSNFIDDVFEWYASRKKTSESIVKAYFTVKTASYFLSNSDTDSRVFEYLESVTSQVVLPQELPDIYKLALTKYYSEQDSLSKEQEKLCKLFIDDLINKDLVFPYTKKLSKFVQLPVEINDSSIICYTATANEKPLLESKVIPNANSYKTDEFDKIYHNLYVKKKVLFEDERWEYRIYDNMMEHMDVIIKGSITPEESDSIVLDRHGLINEMIKANSENNDMVLQEKMINYVVTNNSIKEMFSLI